MKLIMEYLRDDLVSISDNGFRDLDSIVCSLMTTLKYDIRDNITIKELYLEHEEDLFLKLLASNKRYKNMIIVNVEKIKNDDVQFGALKLDIDGNKVIVFQGTDGSIIGWKENFKIGYEYPTKTQKVAIKYLSENLNEETIIVGHSKGGNLALVSALEVKNKKYIKKIYNLDGPGYNLENYNKAKKIKEKIVTYLPVHSFVGVLMLNYNIECVKSEGIGFAEHNIANWYLDDYDLVKSTLSDSSIKLKKKCQEAMDNFNEEEVKTIVEKFFVMIKENNIKTKKDYKNSNVSYIFEELEKLDISEQVKKYYIEMFKVMLS